MTDVKELAADIESALDRLDRTGWGVRELCDLAARAKSCLLSLEGEREPLQLNITKEWFERKVADEVPGEEIGAGIRDELASREFYMLESAQWQGEAKRLKSALQSAQAQIKAKDEALRPFAEAIDQRWLALVHDGERIWPLRRPDGPWTVADFRKARSAYEGLDRLPESPSGDAFRAAGEAEASTPGGDDKARIAELEREVAKLRRIMATPTTGA